MSEYQYYEFQTIDRPLTEEEQARIRQLSRRVELTPTRAIFSYAYSDFPGKSKEILETYFDAMLYLANWGTKQIMFRFPRSFVNTEILSSYCFPEVISTSVTNDYVILDICFNEEEGGFWVEGEGWLASLTRLRRDLLGGDFRLLYLAWLKAASMEIDPENLEGDLPEPPIPANLQNLSTPLKNFIKLFEIDADLIAAASEASGQRDELFSPEYEQLIATLPEEVRNAFLIKLLKGEPNVDIQLLRKLEALSLNTSPAIEQSPSPRRTISELLASAQDRANIRKKQERKKTEEARLHRLNELAQKKPQLWEEIYALIEKKQANAYDEAVKLLTQLQDLAQYQGKLNAFTARVAEICERYRRCSGLLSRITIAGLMKGMKGKS